MHVLIVGAGIIGTASAWFLRQDGHDVTVMDRQAGAALETSLANAGQISVSHAEPWANPDAPLKLLQWLGREDAPLLFRLRAEPHQWLWGLQFLAECLPARTASNIRRIVALALHSRRLLKQLRSELEIQYDQLERGILHFYTDARQFEASLQPAALMRELGCNRRSVDADEVLRIEPALAPLRAQIVGADYCAEDESGDIFTFTNQLAGRAAKEGVRFLFNHTVTRVLVDDDKAVGVEALGTDGWPRRFSADAVIVAAGSYTRELLLPHRIRLPLYPGKGYSATFKIVDPQRAPTVSLIDDEYKIAMSRLGNRLRVAGTAELNGYDRTLNSVRCELLTWRAQQLFPGACDYEHPRYWTGLRPMTPSNVPLIGATRVTRLYVNTGHGTLGWTMGVGSGQLIADVVAGRRTPVELSPV